MSATVVGGAYREVCHEPGRRWYFGSGVRAAAAIKENVERLVTALDDDSLLEVQPYSVTCLSIMRGASGLSRSSTTRRSVLQDSNGTVRMPPCRFRTSSPRTPSCSAWWRRCQLSLPSASVVDPQHSLSLDQLGQTVSADELVIVANNVRSLRFRRESDLRRAGEFLLGRRVLLGSS